MNDEVTLGETHRLLLGHIKENKEYHASSAAFFNEMDTKINTILIATTSLGGRVQSLENNEKKAEKTMADHEDSISHFKTREGWIMGTFGVMLLFGGFFFNALWQNLEYKLQQNINNKFTEYENNKNN